MNKIRSELPDQVAYVLQVPDDETPRFIRKLWNILGDNTYSDIVRWDEVGLYFSLLLFNQIVNFLSFRIYIFPN